MSRASVPVHGGPDAGPPIAVDFSTNAHPMGPNPWLEERLRSTDRSRYPDPEYTALREALAQFHGVVRERVVVGASASELIWRLTRAWSALDRAAVVTDQRTFGEYLRAARALQVPVRFGAPTAARRLLFWYCNPDNPSGDSRDEVIARTLERVAAGGAARALVATDLAYWPFQQLLGGKTTLRLDTTWEHDVLQLWSPNKLHGLTGVRGAYMILPGSRHLLSQRSLVSLAPSWVLGADGVALLTGHTEEAARRFLHETVPTLRQWKSHQDQRLTEAGWEAQPSDLHFGLWQPPVSGSALRAWHTELRLSGIKVRDARSFGRPGWVRLVTRAPEDVERLLFITDRFRGSGKADRSRAEARV